VELASAGLNVISTTEELAFPWQAHPGVAAEIDATARGAGVTVLGTGINPGYAMDYLPMTLSAVARRVDKVVVHRGPDPAPPAAAPPAQGWGRTVPSRISRGRCARAARPRRADGVSARPGACFRLATLGPAPDHRADHG